MLPHAKVDLHVHSRYSDRPSEWFLRRVGAPECFVDPLEVHRRSKARGMDFVTIADHNSIRGALEIADLGDTFISVEATTYFPADGCKVHCLIAGIDERQFDAIQEVRASIFDLHRYVNEQGIFCAVNHPLFRVNDRLGIDHFEQLLVLFNRFELINGTRDARASVLLRAILDNLTPDLLERLAEKHGLTPTGQTPWVKHTTGGSDDHSGVHVASAYTVTPPAGSVAELLEHLREGRHEARGESGGSVLLGHSLFHIAYSYYRERFLPNSAGKPSVLGEMLEGLLNGAKRPPSMLARFVPGFAQQFVRSRKMRQLSDVERQIVEEMASLVKDDVAPPADAGRHDARRTFATTSRITHLFAYNVFRRLGRQLGEGQFFDALQTLASLGTVAVGMAPYLTAFSTQHKDEPFLKQVAAHFAFTHGLVRRGGGKVWLSDTIADANGVARMVQAVAREAVSAGKPLTVVSCQPQVADCGFPLKNFAPVGTFQLPEYEAQTLCFPPVLEVIEHLEQSHVEEMIISTPGPLGLTGLLAARLLGLRTTGIYHHDLAAFARLITGDMAVESLTRKFVEWFYGMLDVVFVPSELDRARLTAAGLAPQRLQVLGQGVDVQLFTPARRRADFWARRGLEGDFTWLYVGSVSRDKGLDVLLEAFAALAERLPGVRLAVVGDGPHLAELRAHCQRSDVLFTGRLEGAELAMAYASADAFVYPSRTDSYGVPVLEAQACGLPAIVSETGAAQEIVNQHGSGVAVDCTQPGALARAMHRVADDHEYRERLRKATANTAAAHTWRQVFYRLWGDESDRSLVSPPDSPADFDRMPPEPILLDVA